MIDYLRITKDDMVNEITLQKMHGNTGKENISFTYNFNTSGQDITQNRKKNNILIVYHIR